MKLSAIELPAIGAQIAGMRTKLDGIQLGGAGENATLHEIAKDADDLAAYVRRFTTPIATKAAPPPPDDDAAVVAEIAEGLSAEAESHPKRKR